MSQPKSVFSLTGQLVAIRTTLKRELGADYDDKIEPVRAALREIAQDRPLVEILQQTIDRLLAREADNVELMTLIAAGLDVIEETQQHPPLGHMRRFDCRLFPSGRAPTHCPCRSDLLSLRGEPARQIQRDSPRTPADFFGARRPD